MRLFELSFFLVVAGCTSSVATSDGGIPDATTDATVPNTCAMAGFVCQSSCSAGLINEQDYVCGASGDYCCAPEGEGGTDAAEDVNVFIDGATFDTGDDASSDDASSGDASGDDAGPPPDATSSDAGHAGHDASDSSTPDAGGDATAG